MLASSVTSVTNPNQLLTYFVTDKLKSLNGMAGLFLATILSGSLSSISSCLNSLAAIVLEDFLKGIIRNRRGRKESHILLGEALLQKLTLPATAAFPLGALRSVTTNNILSISMGSPQTQGAKASSVASL